MVDIKLEITWMTVLAAAWLVAAVGYCRMLLAVAVAAVGCDRRCGWLQLLRLARLPPVAAGWRQPLRPG